MRLAELSDNELVLLVRQEDGGAFTELLARHDGRAFQSALAILRDSYDDASDAMQEARIACHQYLETFDSERGDFCDWYLTIVRNCCQRLYKQRQRTVDWMSADDVEEIIASPLEQLVGLEERSYLCGAVDALPPRQAQAVRMRYLEGYEYSEIAAVMGIAQTTVRDHINFGLKNLRERIGVVGELGA